MSVLRRGLLVLLLGGALFSGARQWGQDYISVQTWREASPARQRELLMMESAPVISRVEEQVSVDEGIVLISAFDPALLAYYLHPRPIWQLQVEPETDRAYMALPPSLFTRRNKEDFPARWLLRVDRDSLPLGGNLMPWRRP